MGSLNPHGHVDPPVHANDQRPNLAGEWEYEDDTVVYTVILDENGNGEYPWNNGRFITTGLSHQMWTGEWSQEKNDRHGRFEVKLSHDYSEGEGHWWYTRIESDTAPQRPGGNFRLTRIGPYPMERIR